MIFKLSSLVVRGVYAWGPSLVPLSPPPTLPSFFPPVPTQFLTFPPSSSSFLLYIYALSNPSCSYTSPLPLPFPFIFCFNTLILDLENFLFLKLLSILVACPLRWLQQQRQQTLAVDATRLTVAAPGMNQACSAGK